MQKRGFFGRLWDLARGIFGVRLSDAEVKNAEVVYHNAIQAQRQHHERLKEAVGRLVYLRNRSESELEQLRRDVRLVERALKQATDVDNDTRSLALIRKRRELDAGIERLTAEHSRLGTQAEAAKEGLKKVAEAVARLKQEQTEMLARKTHALARRQAMAALEELQQPTLAGGSLEALDNVRQAIGRLEGEVGLGEETLSVEEGGEVSLEALRREADDEADHAELVELKAQRDRRQLGARQSEPQIFDAANKPVPVAAAS